MNEPELIAVDLKFFRELLAQVKHAHGKCSCPFCAQARALEKRAA